MPTAGDTPTTAAASSDDRPRLSCFQNSRSTLRRVFGAPGEIIAERPVRSLNHPAGRPINTLLDNALRRPVESAVYTSIAFTDRLIDEGIDPSVGSVGDAYDNALAESQIGLYKFELIHHEGPWRDIDQVEVATAGWVQWFNNERTHRSIDDLTPLELEQLDYALTEPLERAG